MESIGNKTIVMIRTRCHLYFPTQSVDIVGRILTNAISGYQYITVGDQQYIATCSNHVFTSFSNRISTSGSKIFHVRYFWFKKYYGITSYIWLNLTIPIRPRHLFKFQKNQIEELETNRKCFTEFRNKSLSDILPEGWFLLSLLILSLCLNIYNILLTVILNNIYIY